MPDAAAVRRGESDAAAVLQRVLDGFARHDGLPTVGLTLSRLAQLTHSDTDAVQELSNLILADVALTQKLLKLANTVPYRLGPVAVTTITRAIMLLGFNQVRSTAMSVILLDRVLGGAAAKQCRNEFFHSLFAGALAREMVGNRSDVAEEAAIAAMFRNLGRLLVAVYAPAQYERVRDGIGAAAANATAKRELGKSLDELTDTALANWSVPERIRAATQPLPPRISTPDGTTEWIRIAAQFSVEVTHALAAPPAQRDKLLETLLGRYGDAIKIDRAKLTKLLEAATRQTGQAAKALQLDPTPDSAHLADTATADAAEPAADGAAQTPGQGGVAGAAEATAASEAERAETMGTAAGESSAAPSMQSEPLRDSDSIPSEVALPASAVLPTVERDAVGKPSNARDILLAGLAEVTESLVHSGAGRHGGQGGPDLNALIRIVIEAIYRGLGYARTALLMRDPAANLFRTRAGFGEPALKLAFSAQYAPDLFHAALAQATDLHIADIESPKVKPKLPAWFAQRLPQTRSFLLLPLVVNQAPIGMLFADRPVVDPAGLSVDELNLVRSLRNQVVLAIKTR